MGKDYSIKSSNINEFASSIEFKAIKELLAEESLIYVTEFIRNLLNIKKESAPICFGNSINKAFYKKIYEKKALLYVRLSVEDLERKDTNVSKSILNQLLMLLQYCKDYSLDVVGIFYEEDISGSDQNRLEWNKSLIFCENGHADIYLCKTQSRFARDVEMIEKYLHKKFVEWNIRFLSIVDHSDTSIRENKLQRQITAIVDENKIAEQSINVKATLKGKNKAGLWTGSFAPYGYIEDPDNQYHLIIDPPAAKVVQEIYTLYANGIGYLRICQQLNERQIPTPSKYKYLQGSNYKCPVAIGGSKYWNSDTVAKILKDETYDGMLIQNRTETIAHNIKKTRKVPKCEQTIVACSHERIINPSISRIVRNKFIERAKFISQARLKSTKKGNIHVFSQKVYCECCGKIFYKTICSSGKNKKKDYLICKTKKTTCGSKCDNSATIRVEVLEEIVLNELNKQINKYYNQTKFEKIYYEKYIHINYEKDIKSLNDEKIIIERKIKDYTSRFELLYDDRVNKIISTSEFIVLKEKYSSEIEILANRIKEISKEIINLNKTKENKKTSKVVFQKYNNLNKLDRLIVETFISKIIIGKVKKNTKQRTINIIWNICSF